MKKGQFALTEEQARDAYRMRLEGMSLERVAGKFFVHKNTLGRALKHYGLIMAPKAKPVKNLTTGEIFPSLAAAARAYGLHGASVGAVCQGRSKSGGGMRWAYVEEGTP